MRMIKPIIALAFLAQITSCATTSVKHVSAEKFIVEAKKIEEIHSIQSFSYIGSSKHRAYMERQSLLTLSGKPRTVVLWTELDQLPEYMIRKLNR